MSSKVVTIQETESKEQRTGIEGPVGFFVAPEAVVGGPGTVAAEDSTVIQEVHLTGMQPGDVHELLDPIFSQATAERQTITGMAAEQQTALTDIAQSLIQSQAATAAAQQKTIEAVKAPAKVEAQSLIAIVVVMVILFLFGGVK